MCVCVCLCVFVCVCVCVCVFVWKMGGEGCHKASAIMLTDGTNRNLAFQWFTNCNNSLKHT